MTPLKRRLLSILAAASAEAGISFFDLFINFRSRGFFAVADALIELEVAGLTAGEPRGNLFFYSITPAGRAALIPERSAP